MWQIYGNLFFQHIALFLDCVGGNIVKLYKLHTGLCKFTMFSPTPSKNYMAIMVGRFIMQKLGKINSSVDVFFSNQGVFAACPVEKNNLTFEMTLGLRP